MSIEAAPSQPALRRKQRRMKATEYVREEYDGREKDEVEA
jgi:hypothetical protein